MKTETAIAPAYWASYLINGDASGLDREEVNAIENWIADLGYGAPVSCEPYGYRRGAECETYFFLVPDRVPA